MLDVSHDTKYVYTKVKQFKPLGERGFGVILVLSSSDWQTELVHVHLATSENTVGLYAKSNIGTSK